MSSHTINFINALIKIIESKCFIRDLSRPPYQEVVTLRSAVYALDFIIEKIKGKPALTREVLTPKLPQIITVLLDLVPLIPEKVIPLLHKLLINNSTTFRPFGTKFEKQLLNLLHDDENFEKFDAELMGYIMKSLVLLSFSLARTNANEVWRQKVVQLILEIKSVVTIYSHFLNTEDDQDLTSYLEMLPKLPENPDDLQTIFKPLSIDVNDTPFDFLKINRRIRVLTSLLAEYIQTSTTLTVKIPLGYLVTIGETFVGFNLRFSTIKRDIRDTSLRSTIAYSVADLNKIGAEFLSLLPFIFKGDIIPHMNSVFSSLDTVIPVERINGKITVDSRKVIENEELMFELLETTKNYLELVDNFTDLSTLNKIIDASLILSKPRVPRLPDQNNNENNGQSGLSKKKSKKGNVSFSDLLSHQHLFIEKPTDKKMTILRRFFKTLLGRTHLSNSKQTEILRFAILDAVANSKNLKDGFIDDSNRDIGELLETAMLYPGFNEASISVLPIISSLIGKNNILASVLTCPRFPVLPKKAKYAFQGVEEMEDDDGNVAADSKGAQLEVNENVKRVIDEVTDGQKEQQELALKKRKVETVEQDDDQFKSAPVTTAVNAPVPTATVVVEETLEGKVENVIPVDDTEPVEIPVTIDEGDDDSDVGSDFEIPVIDIGDDDDDEMEE
ncbi:unnamed protein product [Ambrosiozyma monospora]|uniref:Unnamed protein product n=1 Tax=Ambrosiozyma monospora TaxID=43982 RepID=A0A9W6Z0Y5_AMBMO|nr:unnamed protein product [Ambrosiozyma monospora]